MEQSEISREIVNSTHRMLEQIKALEESPDTENGNNPPSNISVKNSNQSSDVMYLISSLQTDQSEELLRDVHNWSDSRVHTYETYEKPLLDQMEINQKSDSTFIDEFSPQLKVNINNFDNKLTNAKEAVATLADSLIRQRCTEVNNSSNDQNDITQSYSSNILQFQSTGPNEPNPTLANFQPGDYEQMRLREAHLVQIVTELSNEVESMSNEAVSKNLEILNMQHEAEQKEKELNNVLANNKEKEELIFSFSNRIDELEKQLDSEKKKVEDLSSLLNKEEVNSIVEVNQPIYSDASSQVSIETVKPVENVESTESKEIENSRPPLSNFRVIENFDIDIEADENFIRNQTEIESTDDSVNNLEQSQVKQYKTFGEVKQKVDSTKNSNIYDTTTPNDEFESLLKLENDECPGSSGHSSVLPLGIKKRRIFTENGKRGTNNESYTYRLFFKDREGGAVIVDAEVARRDERTGVMLLKPCDVRTASSPSKTSRIPLFDAFNDQDGKCESNDSLDENKNGSQNLNHVDNRNELNCDNHEISNNQNNNDRERSDVHPNMNKSASDSHNKANNANQKKISNSNNHYHKNVQRNITNSNNNQKNVTNNNSVQKSPANNNISNNNGYLIPKSLSNSHNNNNVTQGNIVNNNPKALTRHQEIMRRILEIHERQMAKIKAARAAAAASYYAVRMNTMPPESMAAAAGFEDAKIIDLNKNVEKQIRFDVNGNGSWSNFSSRPSKLPSKQPLFGNMVVEPNSYQRYNYNYPRQKIVQQKNRKVVVPNQPSKMKSPRRPFFK